ncbi:hypothetical protein V8C42DRAFT_132525 [Trichoderma barbatum]
MLILPTPFGPHTSRTSKTSSLKSRSVTSRLPPNRSHLLLPSPHLLAAATQDPGDFTGAIGPASGHPGARNLPLAHSFRHSAVSSANINGRLILQCVDCTVW